MERMSFSKERSQSVSTTSSSSSVYSENTFFWTFKQLKNFLVSVDSSTFQGRLVQRLRLVGLQIVPIVFFLAICIQQLVSYTDIMKSYAIIYDKDNIRFSVVNLVFKLDNERTLLAYQFLNMKMYSQNLSLSEKDICIFKNDSRVNDAMFETDISFDNVIKMPWSKLNQNFNITSFNMRLLDARQSIYGTNCDLAFEHLLVKYADIIQVAINYIPNLQKDDLSIVTLKHVSALQDISNAHRIMSRLCYLAFEFFNYEKFLTNTSRLYFAGNLTLVVSYTEKALEMSSTLTQSYNNLIKNHNFSLNFVGSLTEYNSCSELGSCNFTKWFNDCINYVQIYEILKSITMNGEKYEGLDMEWKMYLAAIILYTLGILLMIPTIVFVHLNSEMTVRNLKQFSIMFNNQAKELIAEKDRTEILLSEMLPKSVARQLRLGHFVEAETYENATIYFSDIVDFNEITLLSEPIQIVGILNSIYNLLDSRIECYDVYKVETIGSVYMVVSGVPVRNGQQHVVEVADMSLDILAAIDRQKFPDIQRKVELRIGIHTGPCVAGVVGNKMTRYCLFGDTVNTASRMQSTGSASRIHLSESTFLSLNDSNNYDMVKRGVVEVKGKGAMTTYWLDGKNKDEN